MKTTDYRLPKKRTEFAQKQTEETEKEGLGDISLPTNLAVTGGGQDARATWPGHPAWSLQTKVIPDSPPGAARVLVLKRKMNRRWTQMNIDDKRFKPNSNRIQQVRAKSFTTL